MRTFIIAELAVLVLIVANILSGCTNLKVTLPDGTVILYQNVLKSTKAVGAELYYEDPNIVFWVNLSDPNSAVTKIKSLTTIGIVETK